MATSIQKATEVALKELQNAAEVHALRDSLRADLLEAQQERVQDLESKFLEKEEQRRALREASSVLGKLQEEKAVREEAIAHITQGFKRGCAAVGERFKRVEEEVERLKLTVGLRIGGVQSDGDGDSDGDSDEETSANSDEPKEQTQRLALLPCDGGERQRWHGANRLDKGQCCSGLRAWNTDQCLQGVANGKMATFVCDVSGQNPHQAWRFDSGQLKRRGGSNFMQSADCVAIENNKLQVQTCNGAPWRQDEILEPIEFTLYKEAMSSL
eukprot:g3194.t1